MRRIWPWVLVVLVGLGVGLGLPQWTATRTAAANPIERTDLVQAEAQLAQLQVKGRAPLTGYSRDEFGEPWFDLNQNGCDTRNDVLSRDLTNTDVDDNGCVILSGSLTDPYTGEVIDFVRGPDSDEVQIDHVVALADAWQKGAQQWDAQTRLSFANDPANLLAVQGKANQEKGAGDAATWLPRPGYRCVYVVQQIRVKSAYGLWVTQAEKDAMARVLGECRTV